jgi:hypothetical protein
VKPGRNHDGGTAHTLGSGGGSADTFGYGGVAVDARAPAPSWSPRTTRGPTSTTVFRSTNGGRTWTSLKDSAVLNDGGRTWALSGARPAVAKEAPGPIATNAHGSVLLWSLGPANPGPLGRQRRHLVRGRFLPEGGRPDRGPGRRRPAPTPSTPRPARCSPAPTAAGPSPRGPPRSDYRRQRVPADGRSGPHRRPVAQPQAERSPPLDRRGRDLRQGQQLPRRPHPGFRQGRQGRASYLAICMVGAVGRSARVRPGLRLHQRTRSAVRGARLIPDPAELEPGPSPPPCSRAAISLTGPITRTAEETA